MGGWGGGVWFGGHPARGPTVSRCARPRAWGAKEALGLPHTWPLHKQGTHVVVRPRIWCAPGIDPATSRVLSATAGGGGGAIGCVTPPADLHRSIAVALSSSVTTGAAFGSGSLSYRISTALAMN